MTKAPSLSPVELKEQAPEQVKGAVSRLCKKTQKVVIEMLQEALKDGSPRTPKDMVAAGSMTQEVRDLLEWGGLSWATWKIKEGATDVRNKIEALELFREEKDSQCVAFGEEVTPDCGFCDYKGKDEAKEVDGY